MICLIKRIECDFKGLDLYRLFIGIKIQNISTIEQHKDSRKIRFMVLEILQDFGLLIQKKWPNVLLITTKLCFLPWVT